jgi:phosphoribosylanthranilate isomerase
MIIKVCGMRDSRNIQEVSALAVNWIGLIFYERSPRFIGQSPTKQWTVDSGQLTVKYRLSQLSTVNCQLSTVNYQLKKWAFSSTLPSSP